MTVRTFRTDIDREILRHLHSELSAHGMASGLAAEQLEEVFARQGWLAYEEGRCLAGASIVAADSVKEADLIWMAVPGTADVVRESLFQAVLVRAHETGIRVLLSYFAESDTENLNFMDSVACNAEIVAGYSRWGMNLEKVAAARLPEGTSVHALDHAEALLWATRVAWADLPGHKPATQPAVSEAIQAFGAANQFLLWADNGEPVGLVRGLMISETQAYVDAPGLAPEWRKPENYAFLLAHVMSRLVSLGAQTAVMESWGDPSAAFQGFRSAGCVQQAYMPARRIPVVSAVD